MVYFDKKSTIAKILTFPANLGTSMLKNKEITERNPDVDALGMILIECLEPSTFLRKGASLTSDWGSGVPEFVELTKSQSAAMLLKVFFPNQAA